MLKIKLVGISFLIFIIWISLIIIDSLTNEGMEK